jgi:sec-independent protein translocase protein TatC
MEEKRKSFLLGAMNKRSRSSEAEMSFFDHLEELRWHIIRGAIAVIVFASVAFGFKEFLFDQVIFGPKNVGFWTYRMFCLLGQKLNKPDLCIHKFNFIIQNTELAGQFSMHFMVAIFSGIILGFPYLLWELWRFISPALKEKEKRYSTGIIGAGSILFLLGVVFGYFIIFPITINFLGGYTISPEVINQITLDSYISMLLTLSLATGITFELPILAYFLSQLGILTPKLMQKYRRHAYLGILVLAAVITPSPDVMTQLIVTTPLLILFEASILVSAVVQRGKRKFTRIDP